MKNVNLIIAFLILPWIAYSSTFYVSNNGDNTTGKSWETAYTSLKKAIEVYASDDDIIMLDAGIYTVEEIFITKNIILKGSTADGERSIIQAAELSENAANRIFTVVDGRIVTINNISLRNGYSNNNGGAILNSGNLTLNSCRISNSRADNIGGGVCNYTGCCLQINNCMIDNNTAKNGGGGLGNYGRDKMKTTIRLSNCQIANNTSYSSENGGGAVFNFSDNGVLDVFLEKCSLTGNHSASGEGYAITNKGAFASTTIASSDIEGDITSYEGGGTLWLVQLY